MSDRVLTRCRGILNRVRTHAVRQLSLQRGCRRQSGKWGDEGAGLPSGRISRSESVCVEPLVKPRQLLGESTLSKYIRSCGQRRARGLKTPAAAARSLTGTEAKTVIISVSDGVRAKPGRSSLGRSPRAASAKRIHSLADTFLLKTKPGRACVRCAQTAARSPDGFRCRAVRFRADA